jgi:hypothetical protein
MRRTLELAVEGTAGHRRDIAAYVGERLIVRADEIQAEILQRADGIFLWVVIILSLQNIAYDGGCM